MAVTMTSVRNASTLVALLYLLVIVVSPTTKVTKPPTPVLTAQDRIFVQKCKRFCDYTALRRTRCDDDPLVMCQNVCMELQANMTYQASVWGIELLMDACDAGCSATQTALCLSQMPYSHFCEEIAVEHARRGGHPQSNLYITLNPGPPLFALVLLLVVATSDLLTSISKFYTTYRGCEGLYEHEELDATASLVRRAIAEAEDPTNVLAVAKTSFEPPLRQFL
uniref:Secreted protein n=1 Tax=Achlya hypogyna TaxID=1202772 RepID=A0A0A7CPA4_ACHHY|nr:secreted protein [Achlya hypogyna]